MSDVTPFGTQQHFQAGSGSATKSIGSMIGSLGKRALDKVRGDRDLQKHWEFVTSVHAHNEGITHHYEMQRMQASHELEMQRMKEGGKIQRMNISHAGRVGQKNVEYAAGVAQSMPDHNVSMKAHPEGGFEFSAQKVKKPAKKQTENPTESTPQAPAAPKTVRLNARAQTQGGATAAPKATSVTRKRATPPPSTDSPI